MKKDDEIIKAFNAPLTGLGGLSIGDVVYDWLNRNRGKKDNNIAVVKKLLSELKTRIKSKFKISNTSRKIVISGNASFGDYILFEKTVDIILKDLYEINIVDIMITSAGCKSIDEFVQQYCYINNTTKSNHINFKKVFLDWKNDGIRAGYVRNSRLASECDMLITFTENTKCDKPVEDIINKMSLLGKQIIDNKF